MRTFQEILAEVARACNNILYNGYGNNYKEVIESATKIYIAELENNKKN